MWLVVSKCSAIRERFYKSLHINNECTLQFRVEGARKKNQLFVTCECMRAAWSLLLYKSWIEWWRMAGWEGVSARIRMWWRRFSMRNGNPFVFHSVLHPTSLLSASFVLIDEYSLKIFMFVRTQIFHFSLHNFWYVEFFSIYLDLSSKKHIQV